MHRPVDLAGNKRRIERGTSLVDIQGGALEEHYQSRSERKDEDWARVEANGPHDADGTEIRNAKRLKMQNLTVAQWGSSRQDT